MVGEARVGKYLVQTRHVGQRGWRTQAAVTEHDAAIREAERVKEIKTWNCFRLHTYVRVMQGGRLIAAWYLGKPVSAEFAKTFGVSA